MISVVIPLYNKASQIASTLRSVLAQTYQDFEIVVVDDGSTDNSLAEVGKVGDSRIRIIHQPNAGVSAARNKGISVAKGEFIALLDGDDRWEETYLETQLQLAHSYPDCDVFATNYKLVDEVGNVQSTVLRRLRIEGESGVLENYFEVASLSSPPICSISVMARRGVFESVGGFPAGVRLGEDLITWAKLACRYKIAYSKKVCATYVFMSQAARIVPKKQPNKKDVVGEEYRNLVVRYQIPFLKESAAKWHKMRMVTFIQLNMRSQARAEYKIIKSYIVPTKKDRIWYFMSFMPMSVVRSFVTYKSKIRA